MGIEQIRYIDCRIEALCPLMNMIMGWKYGAEYRMNTVKLVARE